MDINDLFEQAQKLQQQFESMEKVLDGIAVTGSAGGAVTVTLSGKGHCTNVLIERDQLVDDDIATLQDLVATAFNKAQTKLQRAMQEHAGGVLRNLSEGSTPS